MRIIVDDTFASLKMLMARIIVPNVWPSFQIDFRLDSAIFHDHFHESIQKYCREEFHSAKEHKQQIN